MTDTMQVIIVLRKEVADQTAARAVYDIVKQKLEDRPDIEVTGHCSNHFDLDSD